MRILAAGGANPLLTTEENVTPLMVAAGMGREADRTEDGEEAKALEAVKVAVELGVDVNASNKLGLTALHGATFVGWNSVVQFLAEKGANLNAQDTVGQTPLHKALDIKPTVSVDRRLVSTRPHQSTADLLLKLGATPVSPPLAQASGVGSANATK